MPDITPNHPAVEAATPDIHSISLREYTPEDCHETIADALNAALPHLTADDLRDTPAGRELMAEAWDEGVLNEIRRRYVGDMSKREAKIIRAAISEHNPYRQADA